jgi:hypothetical protein
MMTATVTAPPPVAFEIDAGVVEDARARQRRHRTLAATATVAALVAAGLVGLIGSGGIGPGAGSVGSPAGGQPIHAGSLSATLPVGWHWRIQQGGYRDCTNPIIRLWLASYPLPPAYGRPEGPGTTVVPASAVLLAITSSPLKSSATPWKRWRLSNRALRPWQPVNRLDPDRIRAEVALPLSAAITAIALLGSIPMPGPALAAANGVLRSIRVDRSYACR